MHLVGVGNEFRGDDAVGLILTSLLRKRLGPRPGKGLTIHAAAHNQDLLVSKLCREGGRVIIADAVEAKKDPGAVICARLSDTKYGYFSTHNIPLKLLPGVDQGDVWLLGVEPASLEVGAPLSPAVRASVEMVVDSIVRMAGEGP